jgi:predicted nucleic acid-binding Zn ribbon protein
LADQAGGRVTRPSAKPAPLGDIVKSVFERLEAGKTLTKEDVEARWKEIAGNASRHTYPASLRKSTLTVLVDSSAWLQEMTMRKRILLKQLKTAFGKDKISGIHFRIGEI